MTTTPNEPLADPQVVPSGDPDINPIAPGEIPPDEPRLPDIEPEPEPV